MFKMIKWIMRLIMLTIIVVGGLYVYTNFINVGPDFSATQTETIDLLGLPEQFVITYLPQKGEKGNELARHEIWLYPSKQKKFVYLAGALINTEDITATTTDKTVLNPKDFSFYSSKEDVEQIIGKVNLASIELPGFYDQTDEIETFASKEAVFIFEQGYLTFMETLY